VLIGILVVAGILGLQILDDSGAGTVKLGDNTSTVAPSQSSTSTSTATRPPSAVRVKVYNASSVDGQGAAMIDKLKSQGWATDPVPENLPTRTGTGVQCVAGFENEAAALATGVGQGAVVESYPASPPASASQADCLVVLGKG
jgi:hypothetical protein